MRQAQQEQRPTGVADAERSIGKVGHGGAECGGGNDRGPVKDRAKPACQDLRDHQCDQCAEEKSGAGQIAPAECHRYRIAAGLSQRRGGDLDNPEEQGDFRHLAPGTMRHSVMHAFASWRPFASAGGASGTTRPDRAARVTRRQSGQNVSSLDPLPLLLSQPVSPLSSGNDDWSVPEVSHEPLSTYPGSGWPPAELSVQVPWST